MLSAFYEVITGRAPDMLRAYLLAVLIQLVVVNTLSEIGFLQATIIPFLGLATLLGGFGFGLGMTLAVGCVGAVFTRAGEGRLDYLAALLAFAVSAWATDNWLAQPIRELLRANQLTITLNRALELDRWVLIAAIVIAAIFWVIRGKRRPYQDGWDWLRTGTLIGIIGTLAWISSTWVGRPYGIGTLRGSDSIATFFIQGDVSALNWNFFMVLGIPIGSFIASRRGTRFQAVEFKWERIPQAMLGGMFMGFGATLALGDNIAHGLSGVPLLALSSLSFMIMVFLGVWAGVKIRWLK
jgi:uncharacterized membrane protein YedE/YeeE